MNKSQSTAAMMVVLYIAVIQPAEAGLSAKEAKQVRRIVNQEVARVLGATVPFGTPGPQGPQGPQGPGGPQGPIGPAGDSHGPGFLFATVFHDGFVDEQASFRITSANVRVEQGFNITRYCFSGLPPVSGGQVTLLAGGRSPIRIIDLHIATG